MKRIGVLVLSHLGVGFAGFALGIYALPILMAPAAPDAAAVASARSAASYTGRFERDRADSDFLHWGEGEVSIGEGAIALEGELAPGPDYRLYLSPEFVETEDAFNRLKPQMVQVGHVDTFRNFLLPLPPGIDPAQFTTVVIWCESFGQFITSARYRSQ